jgi:hypothetical protein
LYINPASTPAAMSHRLREIDRHLLQCQRELARLAPLQTYDREGLDAVNRARSALRSQLVQDGVPAFSIIDDVAETRTVFPNHTNTRFVYLYDKEDRFKAGKYEFYSGDPYDRVLMRGWVNSKSGWITNMQGVGTFVLEAFDWLSENGLAFRQQLFDSAVAQISDRLSTAGIPTDTITKNPDQIFFTNKHATRLVCLNTAQTLDKPCQYKLCDGNPKDPFYTWTDRTSWQIIRSEADVNQFVNEASAWLITHK